MEFNITNYILVDSYLPIPKEEDDLAVLDFHHSKDAPHYLTNYLLSSFQFAQDLQYTIPSIS